MTETYVSIDIEMTTPSAENQELLEIAALKFRGKKVVDSYSTLINPHRAIPLNIQFLTGISQHDVDRAPDFSEVAPVLADFLGNLPLVAHSIASDASALSRKGFVLNNDLIDTYELAGILLPNCASYSLNALAQQFGIPVRQQHRAADDALVTRDLFLLLIEKAMDLDLSVLQEVNRLTALIDWPAGALFKNAEREKSMAAFQGASIRARLAAKVGIEDAGQDLLLSGRSGRPKLEAKSECVPVDGEKLAALLEPEGPLSQVFSGYEHRPQQVDMLKAVTNTLNEGGRLIVEAGTGVGKSMAYLVPSVQFAVDNNCHVVVSTNTINLQDQLFSKDLPDIRRIMQVDFHTCLLKGRSNYLCQRRWLSLRRSPHLTREEALTLVKMAVWLPQTATGDVAEINLSEEQRRVWGKVCATAEMCVGSHCAYFRKGRCYLFRARQEAESAHVVIVNHSLLLSDLATNSHVLPEYQHVIVDEAHHFEAEATRQLGFSISSSDTDDLVQQLSPSGPDHRSGTLQLLKDSVRSSGLVQVHIDEVDVFLNSAAGLAAGARRCAAAFWNEIARFVSEHQREQSGYEIRMRVTPTLRGSDRWTDLEMAWEELQECLCAIEELLGKLAVWVDRNLEEGGTEGQDSVAGLTALMFLSQEYRARLSKAICEPDPSEVYWLTVGGFDRVSVNAAPLHVGPLLEKAFYSTKRASVLTSATLTTAGSFAYTVDRLGYVDSEKLKLGSPFDYRQAAMLLLPNDIAEPETPQYIHHVATAVLDLVRAAGGRTLVLFTSHNQLRQVNHVVKPKLESSGILVLAHGVDGSPRQLLQAFRANPKSVILGTASFWEGVDVVGDALSVLVIARLPFPVPSDPIVAARSELMDNPFMDYSVPQSILRFRQGFGRLIRSKSDRGVAVILDRRILTKRYGRQFVASLPDCQRQDLPFRAMGKAVVHWLGSEEDKTNDPVASLDAVSDS